MEEEFLGLFGQSFERERGMKSSFEAFDVQKLLRMVELYPNDFVDVPEVVVRHQLQNYVRNV